MNWRGALAALVVVAGQAVPGPARAQEEVPFVTTPDHVTLAMLELAELRPGEHLIDLGSGDGRIVITAARRFGARGLGVELAPDLVARSRANARAAGVADRVEFREQDLFKTDLSAAQVITMYLLPEVNLQLRPRLLQLAPGTRIVSHDWDLGDWLPERSLTLDVPEKAIGREKRSTLHLWTVPAQVQGTWCTAGATLTVEQRFDRFSAALARPGDAAPLLVADGRLKADRMWTGAEPATAPLAWRAAGGTLELFRAEPAAAIPYLGRRFTRAGPQGCGAGSPATG